MIVLVFDPLAVLLLVAANWQQKRNRQETKPKEVFIDEGELPEVLEPTQELTLPVIEPININLVDDVPVNEQAIVSIRPIETLVEHNVSGYQSAEVTDEELNITIDDSKDWEPNLYNRLEKRDESLPEKTQSFLNKAKDVFSSIGVKTIEKEVDDLQAKNPK